MTTVEVPADARPRATPEDGLARRTTVVRRSLDDAPSPPRRLHATSGRSAVTLLGALAVGICGATLLFGRLAPFSGLIAFATVAYAIFLVTYVVLVAQTESGPAVVDAVMTVLLYTAAGTVLLALLDVGFFTIIRGFRAMVHTNFYTQDLHLAGPLSSLGIGGIKHAIIGTLWMISLALVFTVPLGIVGAVYLNESKSSFARLVRTVVEAMTALPDIVAGLFIYALWEIQLHQEKSGLAASLALSIMTLPIVIRASDVVLRLVPGNLKEASAALGAPRWRTMWHVVLPTARSGLATAVILATARGIGETAPVLLTAGYTTYTNTNPLHGPMVSLPLLIFELVSSGQKGYITRAFGAATFLLLLVVVLFIVARIIGGRGPGHQNGRQRRRAARQSARDAQRYSIATTRRRPAPPPRLAAQGAPPP